MKYTKIEKEASTIYTRIKNRVDYDLEEHWRRKDFIEWYVKKPRKCFYCNCTKEQLDKFYEITYSKRYITRGRCLEIERKEDKEYSANNCELSCYWCNNAKSDVFSTADFKPIGKAIGKVIKSKINGIRI